MTAVGSLGSGAPDRYPVLLDLAGRAALVVGGGPVAARRAAGLRAAGAQVTVIAPGICEDLVDLVAEGAVVWLPREATADDVTAGPEVTRANPPAESDQPIRAAERAELVRGPNAPSRSERPQRPNAPSRSGRISSPIPAGGSCTQRPATSSWMRRSPNAPTSKGSGACAPTGPRTQQPTSLRSRMAPTASRSRSPAAATPEGRARSATQSATCWRQEPSPYAAPAPAPAPAPPPPPPPPRIASGSSGSRRFEPDAIRSDTQQTRRDFWEGDRACRARGGWAGGSRADHRLREAVAGPG